MNNRLEVIGIDHGWSMMKTISQVFVTGVKEITTTPAFFGDVLEYEGKLLSYCLYYGFNSTQKVAPSNSQCDEYIATQAMVWIIVANIFGIGSGDSAAQKLCNTAPNPTASYNYYESLKSNISSSCSIVVLGVIFLLIHKLLHFDNADMSAVSFAMTVHGLMDYELDQKYGYDEEPQNLLDEYLKWFCTENQVEAGD